MSELLTNKWVDIWKSPAYQDSKLKSFKAIDQCIDFVPKRILDIGCGFAFESELFQKKYNSELWLLDGDFDITRERSREISWGNYDTMKFYSKLDTLKESFKSRNLRYNFIDANNITLDKSICFDLVYSNLSCGFHYPIQSYVDLIRSHTNENSTIIMDLRRKTMDEQVQGIFEILEAHPVEYKFFKCKLKFINR